MVNRLKEKIAIVVGAGQQPGDTIGNGRAISILFAREGAKVMLVDINPDYALAHYNLGALFARQDKPEKALQSYQKALSIQPGMLKALENSAFIQAARGKYDKAILLFKEVINQKPDMVEPYYYIAAIYSRQDKIEQSVQWLKKAVAKGYEDWDNLQQDKNFSKIRNTSYYKKLIEDNSI